MELRLFSIFAVCLWHFAGVSFSQETPTINEKAARYHSALKKRPVPGYLYDRFFDTWMTDGTIDSLEIYLKGEAANSSADQLLLAFFYTKQGDDQKALQIFDETLSRDAGNADAWFQKAAIESKILKFDQAVESLDKAIESSPQKALAIQIAKLKGKLLVRDQKNEEALKVWRELLEANPEDLELYEDIVELQIDEGLFEEAIKTSQTLIAKTKDPYNQVLRQLRLGDIQQRASNRAGALEAYSATLDKTGQGTWLEREVLAQLKEMFRREDDLEGYSEYLKSLGENERKRIAVQRARAEILAELDYEEEAIAIWKTILALTPGDREVRDAFIQVLGRLEKYTDAIEQLHALILQYPKDGELPIKLAEFQNEAKKPEEAGKSLLKFLEISDQSEYAHLRTVRLLQKYKLSDRAEELFKQLVEKFPDSLEVKESYAAFLFSNEKEDEALVIWKELGASGDGNQAIRIARTLVERRLLEEAFALLKSRFDELQNQSSYLVQLCQVAIQVKKTEEAFDWARRNVLLAKEPIALGDAVKLATTIATRSGQLEQRSKEMSEVANRVVQETCLLASLYEQLGDEAEAISLLSQVSGDTENGLLALNEQVRIFRERKSWVEAAKVREQIFQLPGGRKSYNAKSLVELYELAFNYEDSLKWIEEWKKLAPGSVSPWLKQAQLQSDDGRYDASIATLRSAALRFEDSVEITSRMAESYYLLGKLSDSERLFWRLYDNAADATDKLTWIRSLFNLVQEMGRTTHLIERLEERIASNRGSIIPLLALAEVHRLNDDFEERRRAILKASRIQPKDVTLLHQLSSIDESAGNLDRAIATLRSALQYDSSDRTRRRLARLHFMNGDFETGFDMIDPDPTSKTGSSATADELIEVAQLLFRRGAWETAAEFLGNRLSKFPDDYRIHYYHALSLEECEQKEAAIPAFETLLSFDKELPAPTGGMGRNSMQIGGIVNAPNFALTAESKKIQRILSKRYTENIDRAIELMSYSQSAYHYRSGQAKGRIYGFRYSGNVVQAPARVEQARAFALAHLLKLGKDDEAGSKEVERIFSGMKITPNILELIKITSQLNTRNWQEGGYPELISFYKKHPLDRQLHAIWARMHTWYAPDSQIAKNAIKLFEKENPGLALSVALGYQIRGDQPIEEKRANARKALELIKRIEEPIPADQQLFVNFLTQDQTFRRSGTDEKVFLTDELRTEIIKVILELESKTKDLISPNEKALHQLNSLAVFAEREDLSEYLNRLNRTTIAFREEGGNGKGRSQNQYIHANISYRLWTEPVTFPPVWIADIPQPIAVMFAPNQYVGSYGQQLLPEKEKLGARIDLITDPILKLLVANHCGLKDIVKKCISELEKEETPTASSLLILAGYAEKNGNTKDASKYLAKARFLQSDPATSWLIDTGLVNLGLKSEVDVVREAAQGATIRIATSGKLQNYHDRQLVDVMERLGMEKEAMARRTRMTQSQRPQTSRTITQSTDPNQLASSLTQLLNQNQDDKVVKVASKQLKDVATGIMADGMSMYNIERFGKLVGERGLRKKILDAAKPGDDDFIEQVRYAALADIIGADEEATKLYRKILVKRSEDEQIRKRLVSVLVRAGKSEQALALLDQVDLANDPQILYNLFYRPIHSLETFEARFALVELAAGYLEKAKEPITASNNSWYRSMAREIVSREYKQGVELPSMLTLKDSKDSKAKQYIDQQRRVVKRFLDAGLKHPAFAGQAFAYHAALRLREDDSEEVKREMLRLCGDVLSKTKHPLLISNNHVFTTSGSSTSNYGGPANDEYLVLGPIEFAAEVSFQLGDKEGFYDNIIKNLEEGDVKRMTQAWGDMYFCEPNEFGKSLDRLKSQTFVKRLHMPIHYYYISDIWARRGDTDFDMMSEVEGLLESLKENRSSLNVGLVMKPILQHSPHSIEAVFELLSSSFLGEEMSSRKEVVKESIGKTSYSSNDPVYLYINLMDKLSSSPDLIYPTARELNRYGLLRHDRLYETSRSFTYYSHFRDSVDRGKSTLSSSPLVKPFGDMELVIPGKVGRFSGEEERTLSGMLMRQVRDACRSEALRTSYLKWAESEDGFGADLLAIALREKQKSDRAEAMLKYIYQYEERLKALQGEELTKVAIFLGDVIDGEAISSTVPSVHRELWDFLSEQGGLTSDFEEFLATKTIKELGIREYNFDDRVADLIGSAVSSDREMALKLFKKALEIEESSRKAGQWNYRFGSGQTLGGETLDQLFRNAPVLDVLGFMADVMADPSLPPTEIQISAQRVSDKLWSDINPDGTVAEKLSEVYEHLERVYDGKIEVLLPKILQHLFRYKSELQSKAAVEWAEALVEEKGESRLNSMFLAVAQGMLAKKNGDKLLPVEVDGYFAEALSDESIPIAVRFDDALIVGLIGLEAPRASQAAIGTLSEAWESLIPNYYFTENRLLAGFEQAEIDDEWKAASDRLLRGFEKRYFSGSASKRLDNSVANSVVSLLVSICLKKGEPVMANRILSRNEEDVSDFSMAFLRFVEYGEFTSASRLMRKHPGEIQRYPESVKWSQRFDEQVPEFLKSIEGSSMKGFAEVFLAGIPDPSEDSKRSERLAKAAFAFKNTEISNLAMRRLALHALGKEAASRNIVSDLILDELDSIDLKSCFERNTNETRRLLDIYTSGLEVRIRKGQAKEVEKMLNEFVNTTSRSSYQKDTAWRRLLHSVDRVVGGEDFDSKVCQRVLPVVKVFAAQNKWPSGSRVIKKPEMIGRLIAVNHFAGNDWDEIANWVKGHDAKGQKNLEQIIKSSDATHGVFGIFSEWSKDRSLEDRIAKFNRICVDPGIVENMVNLRNHAFLKAIDMRLLTRDEFFEHADEMAKVGPRDGEAWSDISKRYDTLKKDQETALRYFEKCNQYKLSREGGFKWYDVNRVYFETANLMTKGEMDEAALGVLSRFNHTRLSGQQKKKFKEYSKRIGATPDEIEEAGRKLRRERVEKWSKYAQAKLKDEALSNSQELIVNGAWDEWLIEVSKEKGKPGFETHLLEVDELLDKLDFDTQGSRLLVPLYEELATLSTPEKERRGILGRLLFLRHETDGAGYHAHWHYSIPKDQDGKLNGDTHNFRTTELLFYLASKKYREAPIEERILWMNRVCQDAFLLEKQNNLKLQAFKAAHVTGFMSEEELIKHGENMAIAIPRDGGAWSDLSHVFGDRLKLWDQGLDYWKRATDDIRKEKPVRLPYLEFMAGNNDAAREALKKIDPNRKFTDLERNRYERMKAVLIKE